MDPQIWLVQTQYIRRMDKNIQFLIRRNEKKFAPDELLADKYLMRYNLNGIPIIKDDTPA
jgi:hypothetical protein